MGNNKKLIISIIAILLFGVLMAGGTFAWWAWRTGTSDNTNVTFNLPSGSNQLKAILDADSTTFNNMFFASTCAGTYAKKATISLYYQNDSGLDANINATLSLDSISSIHSGTINKDKIKWVLTTTTGNNCVSGIIASGNLGGINVGDTIYAGDLGTGIIPTGTAMGLHKTLYLYFYLDHTYDIVNTGNGVVTDPLQDMTLKVVWNGTITNNSIYSERTVANPPELTNGMVPVKLNENGTVVTTVDPDNSNDWYDYSEQKWANAVLVDSTVRSNYINSTTGDIIPNVNVDTSKILAYYVWIPRYKYTFVYNIPQNPYPVQLIDIVFEGKNDPRATGGANGPGDYYTHPAFTWNFTGDTLDESTPNLGGIWVGKFELSHTSLTTSSMNCTSTSCGTNANNIRILPNRTSLRSNTVSSFFYGIRSMQQSGNSFGLPTATTTADSHMMKNREWGAVVYLAHSVYGLGNQEVRINSNYNFMTGCGRDASSLSSSVTCYDSYGKTTTTSPSTTGDISTYPQSTTGNITGVFDTSGGASENVMGNYNGTNSYAGFSSLPALKYYDKYTVADYSSCTFAECGGHALKETTSWYGDSANFVYTGFPWFNRGSIIGNGADAGTFFYYYSNGSANYYYGARAVVVVS